MQKAAETALEYLNSGSKADDPRFKPISNICMALNALHIYTDEAREGKVRPVMAYQYCSHIRDDLRQCVVYDSNTPDARLIGVEYMIPKAKYLTLDPEEQKLWHSHQFEVASGMLIHPGDAKFSAAVWDRMEAEVMKGVMDLYGKTWHFWQVDRGDELPLGRPVLMGSLVEEGQVDLKKELKGRDEEFGVDFERKGEVRRGMGLMKKEEEIAENADSWWKESKAEGKGM